MASKGKWGHRNWVAKACDYVGVGTVEFLWMKTRISVLQVNTDYKTGYPPIYRIYQEDLVEQQIRVAQG
jgi:acetyl/propionyl-CoA carboxylase alpha subunit